MRRILLAFLPALAIWSCRSSKQSATEVAASSDVVVSTSDKSLTNDDILSFVSTSRDLDLSGISVEYYPPDSIHPYARPSPKSIRIEQAKSKEAADESTLQRSSADERQNVSVASASAKSSRLDSRSSNDFLRPADWVLFCAILGAVVVGSILLYFKFRKSS